VEYLKGAGVTSYVELGPGSVLSGLIKRIDKDAISSNIQDVPSLQKLAAG
jgi:[acyl-carrier-protein] S-malonyltransferase